jgi:hypothetical protein
MVSAPDCHNEALDAHRPTSNPFQSQIKNLTLGNLTSEATITYSFTPRDKILHSVGNGISNGAPALV